MARSSPWHRSSTAPRLQTSPSTSARGFSAGAAAPPAMAPPSIHATSRAAAAFDLTRTDEQFMRRALELARRAEEEGEVPIGAVVTLDGEIVGEGWNRPIAAHDPTAHAEIQAMRAAATRLSNYRLTGAELYVTLEPCDMCVGAMFHARIARAVYGAKDPKKLVLKNHVMIEGGVLADDWGPTLSRFFAARR